MLPSEEDGFHHTGEPGSCESSEPSSPALSLSAVVGLQLLFSPLPPSPPALRSTGQVITSLLVCVQPQEAAPAKSPQSSERSKTTVSKQCSPIPTSSRAFIGSYHLFISELELRQTHADRRAAPPSSTMPPSPPIPGPGRDTVFPHRIRNRQYPNVHAGERETIVSRQIYA